MKREVFLHNSSILHWLITPTNQQISVRITQSFLVCFLLLITGWLFHLKAFGQINPDPVNIGCYRAVLYYCKPTTISDDDRKDPTVFMDSDNQQIIDTVKLLGCNTIFFLSEHFANKPDSKQH